MAGILSAGAYLPRRRLARRAISEALAFRQQPGARAPAGERSYAAWDEDSVTMAVEAARDALAGQPRPASLTLASTSLPFADRSNAGLVAGALLLDEHLAVADLTGSQRAGTSALAALLAAGGTAPAPALIVASERRAARAGSAQELAYGDGAVALLVGAGTPIAECLGVESLAVDLVDHYREAGERFDYALEERWVRSAGHLGLVPQAVTPLLGRLGVAPASIHHFLFPAPAAATRPLAAALGIPPAALRDPLLERCGDTGAAHPLLQLAATLEVAGPGELILVVGFGQGVDALLLRTTEHVARPRAAAGVAGALARGVGDASYLRYLAHAAILELDAGMRAERDNRTAHSVHYRKHRDLTGFVGGRCSACGTVQFPRAPACVNPACRAFGTQAEVRLADLPASVKTYTEDWLAYSPQPPAVYGNVRLPNDGNVFIDFTDVDPGEVTVGAAVRFVFRIKDVDRVRGFRRYFWKATLARS